jgi:hypothetical protein
MIVMLAQRTSLSRFAYADRQASPVLLVSAVTNRWRIAATRRRRTARAPPSGRDQCSPEDGASTASTRRLSPLAIRRTGHALVNSGEQIG